MIRYLFQRVTSQHVITSQTVSGQIQRIVRDQDDRLHVERTWSFRNLLSSVWHKSLVPAGYPESVPSVYKHFSLWRFAQHTITSVAGVLATQSLLLAIVPASSSAAAAAAAPAAAAAMNWVMKDGLGQLGTLLVAGRFAARLDYNPQLWYMGAGLLLEGALLAELLTPLLPGHFVAAGSLASACKGVAMLAGGGAQAALLLSMARRDNIGDLASKAGAQSTGASVLGTALGIWFSAAVQSAHTPMLLAGSALLPLHALCIYFTAASVPVQTLSAPLAAHLARVFLSTGAVPTPGNNWLLRLRSARLLHGPVSLPRAVRTGRQLQALTGGVYAGERYLLVRAPKQARPLLVLHEAASTRDVLQAAVQAALLQQPAAGVPSSNTSCLNKDNTSSAREGEVSHGALELSSTLTQARGTVDPFTSALRSAGWHTDSVVGVSGPRVQWPTAAFNARPEA